MPAVIGLAIDHGVAAKDRGALLAGRGVHARASAWCRRSWGIVRHRFAVTNWLTAAYRTVQLVGRQTVHLGGTLPRKVSTGEVVAIGTSDLSHLGEVMDVTARFAGAIVAFLLISVILLHTSVALGLVVLLGAPLLMLLVGPLLSPLQRRSTHQRAADGAPVQHRQRHRRRPAGAPRHRRRAGLPRPLPPRVAVHPAGRASRSPGCSRVLDALQVFLPGIFVVLVVWLGARYAVEGRITPGELVAFYGYAAFLMIPLRTATEYANKFIRARSRPAGSAGCWR